MPKSAPPQTPERTLKRVLDISRLNGWGVAGFAALCVVVAAVQFQWQNAAWALLATGAGALELHGRRNLIRRNAAGLNSMIAAQFLLMGVIWIYAWLRWRNFDSDSFWEELPGIARAHIDARMRAAGLIPSVDRPLLLYLTNVLVCICLALVTFVYQGGLAFYYALKARPVRAALQAPLA